MTDEHEIKITTNSTRDPLPCALATLRLCVYCFQRAVGKKSEQTKGLPALWMISFASAPKTYSSMLTVSPPSRVTKAAKTFVEIVAGKKMTEPSPRRPWTPLPWNE